MNDPAPRPAPPPAMPALVTPFDRAGVLDLTAHTHNIGVLDGRGVSGFLIAGSTGEGPYLLPGERAALLQSARRAAPGSFLLCGIAAQSVAQAALLLVELDDADGALVVTPTMFATQRSGESPTTGRSPMNPPIRSGSTPCLRSPDTTFQWRRSSL